MSEKKETPTVDSMLHVRTTSKQKASWVKQAQRERMKLEVWVTKTLDEAVAKDGEAEADTDRS